MRSKTAKFWTRPKSGTRCTLIVLRPKWKPARKSYCSQQESCSSDYHYSLCHAPLSLKTCYVSNPILPDANSSSSNLINFSLVTNDSINVAPTRLLFPEQLLSTAAFLPKWKKNYAEGRNLISGSRNAKDKWLLPRFVPFRLPGYNARERYILQPAVLITFIRLLYYSSG